jgi:vancomycin resistance protein VanJ
MDKVHDTMRRLLHLTGWIFGSAVLAGIVLRWFVGDWLRLTRYTGYVMPWLLLGLVPGAAWAWRKRTKALAAVLGTSAAIIAIVHAPLFRPHPPTAPSSAALLSVMSYNTWSRNEDVARIAAVVLRHRPDVLFLQEIQPDVLHPLTDALQEMYDGSRVHVLYDPALLQGIVSRYPLEPLATLQHKGNAQKAVLRAPHGPLTLFNVHPLRLGGWRGPYSQIAALLEEDVLRETTPVILAGDFNAPDHSQLYGMVSRKLRNARGRGFGFTYPAIIRSPFGPIPAVPLVRIDHIFFSPQFIAVRAGTISDSGGSDHRPVFAELALVPVEPTAAPSARKGPARPEPRVARPGSRAALAGDARRRP